MSDNLKKELKYITVYKDLREKILSYSLPPETQLLGVRDLMDHYSVSYATISKALEELEKFNLIKRVQGQGIFVEAKNAWDIEDQVRNLVGLIVTDMNIPFFRKIIKVVESELVDLGYDVIVRNSDFDSKREKEIVQSFINRGVKGIIMVPTFDEDDSEFLNSIDGNEIPIIYILRHKLNYDCNYVVPDDYLGVYRGIEYLIENNHEKIGYISGELIKDHDLRYKAYKNCLSDNNIDINEEWIIYNDHFEVDSGYEAFNKLVDKKIELPSAIFCYTDSMAVGAIKACKENNISVPDDISILSCNNDEISDLIEPAISTINIPIERICDMAVSQLNKIINNQEDKEVLFQSKVSMKLIKRQSVKLIQRGDEN